MKISPVINMPVMTFFPSVAASSAATREATSEASTSATLPQSRAVSRERDVHRRVAGGRPCQPLEQARIVVEPQRGAALVERAPAECRGGRGPDRAVALDGLGPEVGAERDQLREVVHGIDGAGLLDADEPVCV